MRSENLLREVPRQGGASRFPRTLAMDCLFRPISHLSPRTQLRPPLPPIGCFVIVTCLRHLGKHGLLWMGADPRERSSRTICICYGDSRGNETIGKRSAETGSQEASHALEDSTPQEVIAPSAGRVPLLLGKQGRLLRSCGMASAEAVAHRGILRPLFSAQPVGYGCLCLVSVCAHRAHSPEAPSPTPIARPWPSPCR